MSNKFIYYLPRVLAVAFIAFVSMFALDVFGEPNWCLALIIHLIPTYILIAITAAAWKHEKLGGIIFVVAGVLFLISSDFEAYVISTPAIIIGILFLISKMLYKAPRANTRSFKI